MLIPYEQQKKWKRGIAKFNQIILEAEIEDPIRYAEDAVYFFNQTYGITPAQVNYLAKKLYSF